MASPFQRYQSGIQPVTGIAEAGQNLGNTYAQMGETLAKGIQQYQENSAKWDMASSEADVVASEIANTQRLLLSHPAYAPLAQSLNPYIEQLGKVKSSSLPKALSILNASKAAYQSTMQKFPLYEAIRKEREAITFGEGLPEANKPTVRSVPVATAKGDLVWDYTKGYMENFELAGKYYDQFKATHPDVNMVPKNQWLNQWISDLPTQIANDPNAPKQVKDRSIEIIKTGIATQNFSTDKGNDDYLFHPLENAFDAPEYYNPARPVPPSPSPISRPTRPIGRGIQGLVENNPFGGPAQEPKTNSLPTPPAGVSTRDGPTAEQQRGTPQPSTPYGVTNAGVPIKPPTPEQEAQIAREYGITVQELRKRVSDSGMNIWDYYLKTPVPDAPAVVSPKVEVENEVVEVTPLPAPQYDAPSPQAPVLVAPPSREPVIAPPKVEVENEVVEVPPLPAPQTPAPQAPAPQAKAPAKAPAPQAPAPQAVIPEKVAPPQPKAEPKVQAPTPTYDVKPQAQPQARPQAPAPQAKPETIQFQIPVATSKGDNVYATYNVSPSSRRIKIANGTGLFNIGQRTGVNLNAIAKANGFAPNIMPKELFEISERNGGIIIPDRVKKEDLPPEKRDSKKYVSSGMGGGPFAMIPPLFGGVPKMTEEDTAPAGQAPAKEAPVSGRNRKPITPVGSVSLDPVKDEENRIASGMNPDEWAKVKVARNHIGSQNSTLARKKTAYDQTVDWLTNIRDSVADGKSDLVDFGPYGQWESLNPAYATTVQVGFDAGTILLSATKINKLNQGKNAIDKTKMVAERAKKAYEAATKARAEALAKAPKMITQQGAVGEELAKRTAQRLAAEEAAIFEKALKEAGITVNAEVKNLIKGFNKDIYKEAGKGIFWTSLFEAMYGVRNAAPDQATGDEETKIALNNTLDGIRKLRTGYTPMLGFGQGEGWVSEMTGGWKPLTPEEQVNIVGYLDQKLDELEAKRDNINTQFQLNSNTLYDNQRLLSAYGDLKLNSPSAQAVDASGYKPTMAMGTQSIIAAKSFEIPQTIDQKREALRGFMQKRLGYVPAGFETMFQSQFPEATLKMQETPYGVMYHVGQSWKPLATDKGKKGGPEDIAKSTSVMFGQPQPDGTFKATEFIKGSGIKLGGIGAFGTPEAAAKFRENYPKLLKAKKLAQELQALNEETFRSFDPSKWGRAAAKVSELIAQMRITLIGVGSVSDFEQQILRDLVQDPTAFFSLQSTTKAKYQAMLENIDDSLLTMPQSFGLTVEVEKDKSNALLAARQAYQEAKGWAELTPEQRAKIKASVNSK